jgi:peptide-methionine (S)-S-oxide reductase
MAASCLLIEPRACPDPVEDVPIDPARPEQTAVLAGGCFWCTEAVFLQLGGVSEVASGYAGGAAETANYRAVCTGTTGHAEAIRIRFDSRKITYGGLLKVFFSVAHDPTQLNRQGNDRGTQYRSAVFFADEAQRRVAERYIRQLGEARVFSAPIVTTLEPLVKFFPAEDYHQNYAALNPDQPYVAHAALPKVAKVREQFQSQIKIPK